MPEKQTDENLIAGIVRKQGSSWELLAMDGSRPLADVPARLMESLSLCEGATVEGHVRSVRNRDQLVDAVRIGGLTQAEFVARKRFDDLVAIYPSKRFVLASAGERAMRVVDLLAPIGFGTRALIVAPPQAGKTTLLEQVAKGIRASAPDSSLIVLLIDERPEEMTHFRRQANARVFATTSDRRPDEHIRLAEFMLAHMRVELECGRDVIVMIDSLTRLVRAFNLGKSGAGRTLSGGLDAASLEIPRRLFGAARQIDGAGSITVIATILKDTGSRQDQLIYEELKATGNSEIVLDRALAQERVFPAIDLSATGTRHEELLFGDDTPRLAKLRRALAARPPRDALQGLLQLMDKYPTNDDLLARIRA